MFEFDLNPHDLFDERKKQFIGWGIPKEVVTGVEQKTIDTWQQSDGGWCYEWNKAGLEAKRSGNWLRASLCYGAAKFPTLANQERKDALQEQLNCYLEASKTFSLNFERRFIRAGYRDGFTELPVHIFSRRNCKNNNVVILSGGVDTHKMELHKLASILATFGGFRVVAMDMPGTGESNVNLDPDVNEIYKGVVSYFKNEIGAGGKVGVYGISFGGHFAASLALENIVDCCVNIGGPFVTDELDVNLPNGMLGIISNAMGEASLPNEMDGTDLLKKFSLNRQGILKKNEVVSPVFCANGDADHFLQVSHTLAFDQFDNSKVILIPGASHCAPEKLYRWIPQSILFLRKYMKQ